MLVFLGWWWAWISALVNIFYDLWFKDIIVIDKNKSEITDKLQKKWINIIIGEWNYDYKKNDVIIYSDAVVHSKDFKKIEDNKKLSYFEFIWEISKWFKTISIAGTHWKTSTTSMWIFTWVKLWFKELWLWIVGWFLPDLKNNNYFINNTYKKDISKIFEKILTQKWDRPTELFKKFYFFIEADEFNRHFLLLDNYISLITKVDHDHKDIYKTEKEYMEAFEIFKNQTRNFIIEQKDTKTENIEFKYIFWKHMQKNASLILNLYEKLWFQKQDIINSIKKFKWIRRRQEFLWNYKNIQIYTDYAHHPIEIKATLNAFKSNFPNKKIIWIFQPHQIFRFRSYEEDFIKILSNFDQIFIYDIYSVREDELLKELTWKDLPLDKQKKLIWKDICSKINGNYIENFKELKQKMNQLNWICIIMTAWDLDYEMRNFLNQ